MKCLSCAVEIPAVFSSALSNNRCPACGKSIMSTEEFNELQSVKASLRRLEFNDDQLTKIAAAITSRYKLVLRTPDDRKSDVPATVPEIESSAAPEEVPLGEKFYTSDDPLNDALPGEGGSIQEYDNIAEEIRDANDSGFNLNEEQKSELRGITPRKEVVEFMSGLTSSAMPPTLPEEEVRKMTPEAYDRMERARSLQDNIDNKYRFTRGNR